MAGIETNPQTVAKTLKLFIGGEFPRTESGRSFPILHAKSKKHYAHACLASRKDFRNAVASAKEAQAPWAKRSAYNRGQIIYRLGEMMEGQRGDFLETLIATQGLTKRQAEMELAQAISNVIFYAGFTDKYQQLIGSVNPVSGPHHNFTTPEATGVVALLTDNPFSLHDFTAQLISIIASGNSVIAVIPDSGAALIAPLGESLATCDLPKGVVNLLTGSIDELLPTIGSHMEIQGIRYSGKRAQVTQTLQTLSAGNLKRIHQSPKEAKSLEQILSFVEYKTVWHPIGS